jgi:hypothetical protein
MTKYARKSTRKVVVSAPRVSRPKAKKAAKFGKPKAYPPPGFKKSQDGLLYLPDKVSLAPPSKVADEIKKVHSKIGKMIDAVISLPMKDGYEVDEINLTLSFSAKGEFLGIGFGGAASIGIKIKPSSE